MNITDSHELAVLAEDTAVTLIDGEGREWTYGKAREIFEDVRVDGAMWVLVDGQTGQTVSDGYNGDMVAEDAVKLGAYYSDEY